jgi:transposase-like protein
MKQITCPHCGDTYPDFDVAHVCSKGPYAPKLKPKMNKRIKELALQATSIVESPPNREGWTSSYTYFDKEKFAELIVKECRQVLVDMIDEGRGDFLTLDIALIDIDDKFGIEEQ